MAAKKIKAGSIMDFIESSPEELQPKLRQLHEAIRSAAPGAEEGLKWGMPAYSYQKILVTFAVFKNHIGFAPMPSAIKAFAKELSKFDTTAGTVKFPFDKRLPITLIKKIVRFRVKESKAGTIKWRE